ncbi:MAG: DMT family transporter [bacterium]
MLEALIASVGYAGGVLSDKVILCKYRTPIKLFVPTVFFFLALITAVFLPQWGGFDIKILTDYRAILLFLGMIGAAIGWNLFYYKGLLKEDLHEFELIMLLTPLTTIILAEIFIPAERSWGVLIAGLAASIAFIASRVKKHHLRLSVAARGTMAAMFFMAIESIFIKYLLDYIPPVTLYFVRTLFIFIIFAIVYHPKISKFNRDAFALTIISAMFGVVQMVLKFYGFQSLGVIETTMVLLLGPIFVYLFSFIFFKERQNFVKDAITASIIVSCVLYVTIK